MKYNKKLLELHDDVKNHPFLLTFDKKLFNDFDEKWKAMIQGFDDAVESEGDDTRTKGADGAVYWPCPHYVLYCGAAHDLNMRKTNYKFYSSEDPKSLPKMLEPLNSVLGMIHAYAEGRMWDEVSFGKDSKLRAVKGECGWRCVACHSKEVLEKIERRMRSMSKVSQTSESAAGYLAVADDIKNCTGIFYEALK